MKGEIAKLMTSLEERLYIPHGSDESLRKDLSQILVLLLYIPHGSDESSLAIPVYPSSFCFISHMVQMKESLSRKQGHAFMYFISHMVQMKDIKIRYYINA